MSLLQNIEDTSSGLDAIDTIDMVMFQLREAIAKESDSSYEEPKIDDSYMSDLPYLDRS